MGLVFGIMYKNLVIALKKPVIIFLSINLIMGFGAQKNHLIEMVLLSIIHNICFG